MGKCLLCKSEDVKRWGGSLCVRCTREVNKHKKQVKKEWETKGYKMLRGA
ncbi:MAG: hypothetical protein QY317_08970 [Candidatus Jettenia caeni]|nr:MAG: hypothetical protein QY317_08970 [Candidatus Jettenia caeni]